MSFVEIIVISAGTLGLIGYIPQIRTMIRMKSNQGLNPRWVGAGQIAWIAWLWYGIYLQNVVMMLMNTAGVLLHTTVLILLFINRKKG